MAMAESSNLMLKSRDVLATPSHEGFETIVEQLAMRQETKEYKTAFALFDFCATRFPNCYTLKLLKVYRCSSNNAIRYRSIYILAGTLADLRNRKFELSRVGLHEIKPLLIECLTMQETKESDMKILRRIVSIITYNVMVCDNGGWNELSDCILWLASTEPLKAFHVFLDLPAVYGTFIDNFMNIILEEAEEILVHPEKSEVEGWSLALETVVKLGIQVLDTEMRVDLIKKLINTVVNSVKELVEKGMEQFLVQGLQHLEGFLSRDKTMYGYNKSQCHFVMTIMFKIKDFGTQTKDVIRKINQLVKSQDNAASKPVVKPQETQIDGVEYDRGLYNHLKTLSSVDVLKIFMSNAVEDRSREIAIKRLEVVLSDHTSMELQIDISEMRELQSLLISCLKLEGISDSMFKVLEISRRLNPPTELLVDNSCWVLAFTGAFCATIHLIEILSQAESCKEIANKMIDSVRELVERGGMEVGLVRRAFRDLESIVKKQLEWYETVEYKFVKGLLWKLYAIKGMKWESKIVLWRINVIVERQVNEEVKVFPKGEFDWLNLPEA
ncbi:PREDICTED: uncharacterized protein LOC104719362 isoform X3 [Camelina sativa]|uniref:Uncharacterized protein LOC104719362 isoform X3 n=1 Tax=Camelina sativa TaxID=90675 RepID=A0ABM1QIE2_CAMSA|nr:PREDICTED: uncharacterized protein LOC104719362 isoform X3 [Camelina sativa]